MGSLSIIHDVQLGSLVLETCCKCKTPFAMEESVHDTMSRLKEDGTFHCPLGHPQHYRSGESEADKMRRERDKAVQNAAYLQDLLDQEKRSLAATKGQIAKIKNRVGHGVCPCCNRTFQNLQRHMTSKHKDYSKEAA